jgi:long-chain fatty acid transport protein
MRKWTLLILLALVLAVPTVASGPSLFEMGSKASAQAGAFTARADDATAVFYNPAGLVFQGNSISFNLTYLNVNGKYSSPTMGTHQDQAENFFVPAPYVNWRISDRWAFGFAVLPHYNLATEWTTDFPGRFASRRAKLLTFTYRPVVAFKLNDHNAFAFGIDYHDSKLQLKRNVDTTLFSTDAANGFVNPYNIVTSEGIIDTELRGQAWGWNFSYMGKWSPWSLGFTYQSRAAFDYSGHTNFVVDPAVGSHAAAFQNTDTDLRLTAVPAYAALGLAYTGSKLQWEFDVNWTGWDNWDHATGVFKNKTSTVIRVPVPGVGLVPVRVGVVQDEPFTFNWNDTYTFRLGFAYPLSPKVELRWGVLYDQAPVPDRTSSPVLPDQARWSLQIGTGYKGVKWGFDWYVMYLDSEKGYIQDNNMYRYNSNGLYSYPMTPDGYYKFQTWLAGVQVNYKF